MQNSHSRHARTRQNTWSWPSLVRRAEKSLEIEKSELSLEELMALMSDESINAQRNHWIDTSRPPRA